MRLNDEVVPMCHFDVKSLYGAETDDPEYSRWFKEFVESYRCRICKKDLNLDNFGGLGPNHMIYCKDCSKNFVE